MRHVTSEEYKRLVQDAQILEQDRYGPKVLLVGERIIVKLFRRKRFFSRMMFSPGGKRFAANAHHLKNRRIDTVTVVDFGSCSNPARDMVWYEYLEGTPFRELCLTSDPEPKAQLIEGLGRFVARLHQQGVLFRSLHWNNILLQPGGRFALIDILDVRVQQAPLFQFQRRRNFSHLFCRHRQDLELYLAHKEDFWKGYSAVTELSAKKINKLKQLSFSSRK